MKFLGNVRGGVSSKLMTVVALLGVAFGSGSAMAQTAGSGIDVTAVTGVITSAGTSVATVGVAILAVIVGIVAFNWVRRAIH